MFEYHLSFSKSDKPEIKSIPFLTKFTDFSWLSLYSKSFESYTDCCDAAQKLFESIQRQLNSNSGILTYHQEIVTHPNLIPKSAPEAEVIASNTQVTYFGAWGKNEVTRMFFSTDDGEYNIEICSSIVLSIESLRSNIKQ
jgi:hypothetical protein